MKYRRPASLREDLTEGLIEIEADPRRPVYIGKPTRLSLALLALAVFGLTALLIIGLWPIPKP